MSQFLESLRLGLNNELETILYALAILAIGWMIGRLLGLLLSYLFRRSNFDDKIAAKLRLNRKRFIQQMKRWIIWFFMVLSIWLAWSVLSINPTVSKWLKAMQDMIEYILGNSIVVFITDIIFVLLATWLLIALIKRLGRWCAKLTVAIEKRHASIRPVKIQRLVLLSTSRIGNLLILLVKYIRFAIILGLIIIYLAVVFSFFPQTRGYVFSLLNVIFTTVSNATQSFARSLPNLLNLIFIIIAMRYTLIFIHYIFNAIGRRTISFTGFYPEWAEPTYQIVRILVIALALVIAFPYIPGSSSPIFQGISIFLGFLLSLGSSSVVANIMAGIVLTYTRAFKVSDRVQISDTIGDVIERTLLVTRVRTIKNVDISIPNSVVLNSHIVNYSASARKEGLILNTTVTIGYDAPWRDVHKALIEAAKITPGILAQPAPFVFQTSLDDSFVAYEINAYTNKPNDMAVIYSQLHQNIQDKFNEVGIEIMSPHYAAVRDGNQTTIPQDYRPKGYQPSGFRIENKNITKRKS